MKSFCPLCQTKYEMLENQPFHEVDECRRARAGVPTSELAIQRRDVTQDKAAGTIVTRDPCDCPLCAREVELAVATFATALACVGWAAALRPITRFSLLEV